MEYLAVKILELRKKFNYSQEELADKIGVTRQAISKWERDDGLPDLYNVKRLATVFQVSVDELLQEKPEEPPVVQNKNKLSIILMGIPGFIFLLAVPVLFVLTIVSFVPLIIKLFTPDIVFFDINIQLLIVPILDIVTFLIFSIFIKMYTSKKASIYKIINIAFYGILILVYLLLLLTQIFSGFSLIFLYIVGLLVLVSGLVGVIIYNPSYISELPIKHRKTLNISTKLIKYLIIGFILSVAFNYIEDTYLVAQAKYITHYSVDSDNIILDIDTTSQSNNRYDIFVNYKVTLPENISKPSVKIYAKETLIAKGDLEYKVHGDYNYQFNDESLNTAIALYIPEDSLGVFATDYLYCIVTYEQDGQTVSETLYPSNPDIDNVTVYEPIWIWKYNRLSN